MKQAIIIIDLIEDIIGEQGHFSTNTEQAIKRQVVAKTNKVTELARKHHIPVVWVKVGFADDYHDIPKHSPMFNHVKQIGILKLSHSGCDWVKELVQQADDRHFVKKGVGAFAGNQLNNWLKSQGIEQITVGGVSSIMTIENTSRLAHDLGYKVVVLEELCAAASLEQHQQSMQALEPMAKITSIAEWMAELS
ncbi:cysteine hydrolase [Utexia brackfieldae]|uniref:cysteine hydrolase family protein n=1 Tax=Utexia brackfieldae TaxID=3074108 RepID=UPI00370DD10B